jgi:hypothetical protein
MVEDIVRAHGGWFVTAATPGDPAFRVVFPLDGPEEAPLLVPATVTARGYATAGSQSTWVAAGATGFVAKPYRIQEVAQRLREALDRSQPRVS